MDPPIFTPGRAALRRTDEPRTEADIFQGMAEEISSSCEGASRGISTA